MGNKPVKPVAVEPVKFGNTFDVEIPQGKAYVIPLVGGKEDYLNAFFIGIRTADAHFAKLTDQFIVKKNN